MSRFDFYFKRVTLAAVLGMACPGARVVEAGTGVRRLCKLSWRGMVIWSRKKAVEVVRNGQSLHIV